MKIIKPSVEILSKNLGVTLLKQIEEAGRTCYKSEDKIIDNGDSAVALVKQFLTRKHEAMLEFADITVRIICDRGVTHEIVRHRVASYAQESTRYCNYAKDKFGNELTFIEPCFWRDKINEVNVLNSQKYGIWKAAMRDAEDFYLRLIEVGATPQEARAVLPNSLKTEIVMKANIREWRHFFKLRCSNAAHPQMREISIMLLNLFCNEVPVVFDDLKEEFGE